MAATFYIEVTMKKVTEEQKNKTYAALKLLEALHIKGMIPKHVFKNILEENKNIVDLKDFRCYNV